MLERIVRTSPAVTFLWDVDADRAVYVNGQTEAVLGCVASDLMVPGDELRAHWCHPEDHALVFETIRRVQESADNETVECEYRMRHRDGSWRWVLNRSSILSRNGDGRGQLIIGVVFDKTERHNTATSAPSERGKFTFGDEARARSHRADGRAWPDFLFES